MEFTGDVCCAHCICMAGLNEVCSHVAAVLFYLETSVRISGLPSVTQQKCQWTVPAFQKKIPYSRIKDMDFSSSQAKKRKLDDPSSSSDFSLSIFSKTSDKCGTPSASDMTAFYQKLSLCKTEPAFLSLVPPHSAQYIPSQMLSTFPQPLSQLFQPKFQTFNNSQLSIEAESIDLQITPQHVMKVEQATRGQSTSKMWYKYRSGRITASKMKRVCKTSTGSPSHQKIGRSFNKNLETVNNNSNSVTKSTLKTTRHCLLEIFTPRPHYQ